MKRSSLIALLISLFFIYLFVFSPAPGAWMRGEITAAQAFLGTRVDWPTVARLLVQLKWLPFGGALVFLVLSLVVRAWRWRVIARPMDRVPMLRMFHLTNLGYMANNLLPMRLGEVLRAGALAGRSQVPMAGALATIVLERMMDMIGALSVLVLMLLLQGDLLRAAGGVSPEALGVLARFRDLAPLLGGAAGLGLAVLLALVIWRDHSLELVERLLTRFLPAKPAARLHRLFATFSSGLEILRSPWEALLLLGQTALLMSCYLASLACMVHAYGLEGEMQLYSQAPVASLLLLLVFVSLGYMIPAAPGAFGTVQYFTALAMGLIGAGAEEATSFALGNHLITWLVLTLLGLVALPLLRLRFSDVMQWKESGA